MLQSDIFKFFPDELSGEMKSWKIAIVVDSQFEKIGKSASTFIDYDEMQAS